MEDRCIHNTSKELCSRRHVEPYALKDVQKKGYLGHTVYRSETPNYITNNHTLTGHTKVNKVELI